MKRISLILLALSASTAFAGHVAETLTLAAGWNSVYLESTPDASAPADSRAAFRASVPRSAMMGS